MAIKVIVKKRFTNSVKKVAKYLADEWGQNVAIEFAMLIEQKIILISSHPQIGSNTALKNTKLFWLGRNIKTNYIINMMVKIYLSSI